MSRLVVVADANPDRADRIREACAVRGYATRAVATGADALEACVADVPEVLVTVGPLALIEAGKLVEILRTNPRTRRVRFVFVNDGDAGPPAEWGAVHLSLLSTHEDQARTLVDWTWSGFTHERVHRIDIDDEAVTQEEARV